METAGSRNMKLLTLGAAGLLILAASVWFYQRQSAQNSGVNPRGNEWCKQKEDCIWEAVFRYEMQHSEGHESSSLFFLSVEDGRDPDSELVKRLASGSLHVTPLSQSINQRSIITDKNTGELGVILRVGKITWVDNARVQLGLSAYSGWGDVKAYVYHLAFTDKRWIVTDREFAFESLLTRPLLPLIENSRSGGPERLPVVE